MLEISHNHLTAWEKQNLGDVTSCMENVMLHWLSGGGTRDYPTTWQGLCTLLDDLNLSKVAEDLMKAVTAAEHTIKIN